MVIVITPALVAAALIYINRDAIGETIRSIFEKPANAGEYDAAVKKNRAAVAAREAELEEVRALAVVRIRGEVAELVEDKAKARTYATAYQIQREIESKGRTYKSLGGDVEEMAATLAESKARVKAEAQAEAWLHLDTDEMKAAEAARREAKQ
ncbi:hypothetical protein MRQ47_004458 [Salmonella enterica]|nr:hypothetical protein [Salmonella enterica]